MISLILITSFYDCERISINKINSLSKNELAKVMMNPIIVTDAMSHWDIPKTYDTFSQKFGHHLILARRTRFARIVDSSSFGSFSYRSENKYNIKTSESPHIPVTEYMKHFTEEYIVLFDHEPGMSEHEQILINDLKNYRITPSFLSKRNITMFFSFGSNRHGANTANHGFTWIALVSGTKLWHVADGQVMKPAEPNCNIDPPQRIPNTLACIQRENEIMTLPTAWWHSTCNLDNFTIGVGGQDSCDLGCQRDAIEKNLPFCQNKDRHYKCWGADEKQEL